MTLPLGGLALQDISSKSLKKAEKIVEKTLDGLAMLKACEDRTFYAVGGTWRALARLHMWQTGYPFHVMHNYPIAADEALEFARLVHRVDIETLSKIEVVNNARRPLLPYAALVLEYIVRVGKPRQVMFSVLGVREGLLYSMLKRREQEKDPLIEAARHLNQLRSRSPRHGEELIEWTDRFMVSSGLDETARNAGCAMPRACSATSAGARIPIIAASSRSISSPMAASAASIIPAAPIWRSRCSSATSAW